MAFSFKLSIVYVTFFTLVDLTRCIGVLDQESGHVVWGKIIGAVTVSRLQNVSTWF